MRAWRFLFDPYLQMCNFNIHLVLIHIWITVKVSERSGCGDSIQPSFHFNQRPFVGLQIKLWQIWSIMSFWCINFICKPSLELRKALKKCLLSLKWLVCNCVIFMWLWKHYVYEMALHKQSDLDGTWMCCIRESLSSWFSWLFLWPAGRVRPHSCSAKSPISLRLETPSPPPSGSSQTPDLLLLLSASDSL